MILEQVYIGIIMFLCVLLITGLGGGLVAYLRDDEDILPYGGWVFSAIGFAVFLTILYERGGL